MKQITIACFSPSGGTKRAAELLAGMLGEVKAWCDLIDPAQRSVALGEEDLLVLALPVYAGRIPAVDGLSDGLTGRNTPCVLLAAYGNRHYDDALAQMKEKLNKQGFRCVGGAAVITPHIFAPELGSGRPDVQDCALLADFACRVREKLAEGNWEEASLPGQPVPEPKKAVPVPKSRDWEKCVRCGLCARRCPTGAMDGQSLDWDMERCISCMACVNACPKGALRFDAAPIRERLTANFSAPRAVEIFL